MRASIQMLAALGASSMLVGPTSGWTGESPVQVVHHTEWARMRDGVLLASEIFLPKDVNGPLPVIMVRSPYNGGAADCPEWLGCQQMAARGYVVVNQDVRGTSRSHGHIQPFVQERNDGYDAVEWAAAQPWSNGKVGLAGASYLGVTAMQAAAGHPPHLVAVMASLTGSDYHDNWAYANGVFDLWFGQSWLTASLGNDSYRRGLIQAGLPWGQAMERATTHRSESIDRLLPSATQQVPLQEFSGLQKTAPFYYEWLAHPAYDGFWSAIDLERQYENIQVPVFVVGGWYDIFSVGTLRNFVGLRSHGGSVPARQQTRLVMAPVCHEPCNDALKFDVDPLMTLTVTAMNHEWWDYWLKGIDTGVAREPAVKLFVMTPPDSGDQDGGFWTTANEYPLPGTKRVKFNLRSRGNANTRNGDGVLDPNQPSSGPADRFTYDPANPVPTLGGNLCCLAELLRPGVFDQSQLELRDDVLVYTSAPLQKDLTVIGPVTVTFWATSSAPDTDFTAKLVQVRPDGSAFNLLDRIVNARLRKGSKAPPSATKPGRAYEYRLELGNTANVFKAGHRVRLEISSSNFPHFARNPNTGRQAATESVLHEAQQTIRHDATHPSYLELPTLENVPRSVK